MSRGLLLREAIKKARALGIEVEPVRGTGEIVFKFARRRERVCGRRKDVSRRVALELRRLEEER